MPPPPFHRFIFLSSRKAFHSTTTLDGSNKCDTAECEHPSPHHSNQTNYLQRNVNPNGLNAVLPKSNSCKKGDVWLKKIGISSKVKENPLIFSRKPKDAKHEKLPIHERLNQIYEKVLVVDNKCVAEENLWHLGPLCLYCYVQNNDDEEKLRVNKIDLKQETPVDHGEITCFCICSGSQANFGNNKSCIWVDVLDGGGISLLAVFAPFFEDPSIKKVWHNYSFQNHVIENYGLNVSGFHADTMHMAHLWDSSRRKKGSYSLEALTSDPIVMSGSRLYADEKLIGEVSLEAIFGRRTVKKDGFPGKNITVPPVEDLQRGERNLWVSFSSLGSINLLNLYESLKTNLSCMGWNLNGVKQEGSMFDFYERFWRPYSEVAVKMESAGMLVDQTYLAEVEKVAKAEQQIAADRFRNWASKYCSDARYMNMRSEAQLLQLFFGGVRNRKNPFETLPEERQFKIPHPDEVIREGKINATKREGKRITKRSQEITLHNFGVKIKPEIHTQDGWPSVRIGALKILAGDICKEFDFTDEVHQLPLDDDNENMHGTMMNERSETFPYGTAFAAFGGNSKGIEACNGIAALIGGTHISGKNGRIHCHLNINTETGRLSTRKPHLQNQPSLEKDRFKIRQAFMAAPGNSFIVADYGQMELRIIAHLSNCRSVLDAFNAGVDFHSNTTMDLYPHIRDAVEQKRVLLEWHPPPGEDKPPVPLVKLRIRKLICPDLITVGERDCEGRRVGVYQSRFYENQGCFRKPKKSTNRAEPDRTNRFLNAHGSVGKYENREDPSDQNRTDLRYRVPPCLVSVMEAKRAVARWYSEREEVRHWRYNCEQEVSVNNRVHTLLGRTCLFPPIHNPTRAQKAHIARAAISATVQGSAADIGMCALLEISKNARLKELGWRLLLQVYDEVILEGPTESAAVAKAIVLDCMSKPFDGENILRVGLAVDAECTENWYSAKCLLRHHVASSSVHSEIS
ncbi:hypothetical protein LguiB_027224 [Lonicera macranthoides]